MDKELRDLLSKPAKYYKDRLVTRNPRFDYRKPVILFGAGNIGKELLFVLKRLGTKAVSFSDNNDNKIGKLHCGIKIISLDDIRIKYETDVQIIVSCVAYDEVISQLRKLNFTKIWSPMYFLTLYAKYFDIFVWSNKIGLILQNKSKIIKVYKLLKDKESKQIFVSIIKYRLLLDSKFLRENIDKYDQYFNSHLIKLTDKEIFLDGGAYDGNTTKLLIKKTQNRFIKIFAFDPDKRNFRKLYRNLSKLCDKRIKYYNLAVGATIGRASFSNEGSVSSRIMLGNKTIKVPVVPIDKYQQSFTYIKLDIEGYEKQALLGARKTLKTFKPKLAISAYHHLEDLWEIPLLIKKISPTYNIFFRKYSNFLHEILCYAN